MRRREFIAALSGAAAWPLAARAQQPEKLWRIGMLETIPPELNRPNLDALRRGLQELGYVEGHNYILEYRSADGQAEQFPRLAAELVQSRVDLIVTRGTPAAQAAKAATSTIPIVMAAVGEALGVVESLAHPGGNVTGMSAYTTGLAAKRVELLKELLPDTARVAYLHNMSNPVAQPQWEQTEVAAHLLGIIPELYDIRSRDDVRRAFESAIVKSINAVFVGNDSVTQENRSLIAELAARDNFPTIYGAREFVEAGGLMSYSVSYPQLYYESARLVNKIFHGSKAGRLACRAADQVQPRDKSNDGEGTRFNDPRIIFAARRRGHRMKRREFIAALGSAATGWPLFARAQQGQRERLICILEGVSVETPNAKQRHVALLEGLQPLGWTLGRNVRIEVRWGEGDEAATRRYAAELVALNPDVLVAGGGAVVEVMLKVTHTIPIVFVIVPDPVGSGFVESLSTAGHQRHRLYDV